MPIKIINGQTPLKERYRMFIIDQHNIAAGPPSDYSAFWKFDNSYNDEKGSYNLSVINGGTPPGIIFENGRKGDANGSVRFQNTTSNYSYLNKTFVRISLTNGFCLSAWIKVVTPVPNVNTPIEMDSGVVATLLRTRNLFLSDFGAVISGGTPLNTVSAATLGTTWRHHIFNVASDGKTDYYIDNVKILDQAALAQGRWVSCRFGYGSGSAPFNGNLDDVRIYERVLTEDEITALYNE